MGSITSANAVLTLTVDTLFPTPNNIQGWSADEFYAADQVVTTETLMGIDGILSGGFVFEPTRMTVMLQADSPSIPFFEAWWTGQVVAKDVYIAGGLLTLPSIKKKWVLTTGFLTALSVMPDAGKTQRPRRFAINWQSTIPQPNV